MCLASGHTACGGVKWITDDVYLLDDKGSVTKRGVLVEACVHAAMQYLRRSVISNSW